MEPEKMDSEQQDPEDLGAELINRFRNSILPEHKQLRAVVGAISEALREQGLPLNFTGYFAGVMLALERQSAEGSIDGPETAAFCTLLSLVMPRLGISVLRARSEKVLEVLGKILSCEKAPAGTIKSGIACVEAAIVAGDKSNWFALMPPFGLMLKLSVDSRPKVRKRAHTCIAEILSNLQSTSSFEKASDAAVSFFVQFITPFTGISTTKTKDHSKEAVQVLYILGALSHILPALSSKAIAKLLPGLVSLFNLKQAIVTRHVLNALLALSRASRVDLPGPELSIVIGAVSSLISTENRDVDQVMASIHVLQTGLIKLRDIDRDLCASNLPAAFNSVIELFASEQEEVTFGAGECLQALVSRCIDDQMIRDGLNAVEMHGKRRTFIDRICVSVEKSLSYQYSSAWDKALSVVSAIFTKLGAASFKLMPGALGTLAELQGLGDEDMPFKSQLSDAFGAAVVAMGPEHFLQRLPLNMDDQDLNKARVWIIPILRQHIVGARLKYFAENIVPLAQRLTARAQKYAAEEKPVAGKTVEAWAQSLWALLPSFCNYPLDTKESFKLIAKLLGEAMKNNPELRGLISSSIQLLVHQNKKARERRDEMDVEGESEAKYSRGVAFENLSAIAAFSDKFLPLLFNLFCESPVEKRGDLQAAIGAIASISSKAIVQKFFNTIVGKLLEATKEQDAKSRRCMFMDLALSLVEGLDSSGLNVLFTAAKPALQDGDPGVQKKGYKVLAKICKEHPDFLTSRSEEIFSLIQDATLSCQTSAKQYRVLCLQLLILHLVKEGRENSGTVIQFLLKEAILALKEANKKTRNAAFDLLVGIGHGLLESSEEDLRHFFHMVVGCSAVRKAAGEPHLISSAITAISRLAYEFSDELGSEVQKFLPSAYHLLSNYKSREVIKSLLGLMKVMVANLSKEELDQQLHLMVPSMMAWSDDPKNRFRAKVRLILEKLIKKCGLEAVSNVMPKEHAKHLTNIRKRMEQTEKKKRSVADGDDKKSLFSRATSRSQWKTADVFSDSDDDNDGDDESEEGTMARSKSTFRSKKLPKSKKRLPEENEPLDLLDNTKTRAALSSAKLNRSGDDDDDYDSEDEPEFDPEGRLIVGDSDRKKKRARDETLGDEDDDDQREKMSKSSRRKEKFSGAPGKRSKKSSGWAYTGEDYANKKGGGGGDRKKEGKLEPYAYWPLDAKLLNRRGEKKAAARKGMQSVVKVTKKLQGLSVNKALGGIQKKSHQNKAHKGGGSKRKNRR